MKRTIELGPHHELWARDHPEPDTIANRTLGFWLYMLSDSLLFAGLFAAYAVLNHRYNYAHGPTPHDIAHPFAAFVQTIVLFTSVLTYSFGMVAMRLNSRALTIACLLAAAALGCVFLGLEISQFASLIAHGITPERSGYLSIFFILVGTHGLHMAFGLLWMLVMIPQIALKGFTAEVVARLLNLRMFWTFQASIWVCVFVFVYLNGAY